MPTIVHCSFILLCLGNGLIPHYISYESLALWFTFQAEHLGFQSDFISNNILKEVVSEVAEFLCFQYSSQVNPP